VLEGLCRNFNPLRRFSLRYVQICLKGLIRVGFRVLFIGPESVGIIFKIRLQTLEDNLIISNEDRYVYLKGSVFNCCEIH
jgi:hypothetical protein